MLPMSHATTGIVAQPGEIGTAATIPPAHVTNLMLPSHIGGPTIPVHTVTLVPMTSGQPQLLYSMSSQPSVPPAMISSAVTSSAPVDSQPHTRMSSGQLASPSVGSSDEVRASPKALFPSTGTVKGSLFAASMNPPLPNQIPQKGERPADVHSSIPAPNSAKPDTLPPRVQFPTAVYARLPSQSDRLVELNRLNVSGGVLNPTSVLKAEDNSNNSETLVVEMQPVGVSGGKLAQNPVSTQNDQHDSQIPMAGFVTDGPAVTQEAASEIEYKEPTLTLSEEGVVNRSIEEASDNALHGRVEVHTLVESSE